MSAAILSPPQPYLHRTRFNKVKSEGERENKKREEMDLEEDWFLPVHDFFLFDSLIKSIPPDSLSPIFVVFFSFFSGCGTELQRAWTGLWFWMKNVRPVVKQGFSATIRRINGGECNGGRPSAVAARVKYYRAYCRKFGITPGPNISC
ncbi:Basic endochitinase CHB4 [Linum perenne]